MPEFDAVIPAFNARPEWLRRAVASVFACQAHGLVVSRVIIIDDGSDQPVDPVWFDGVAPDDRARLDILRHSNAGPSAARNRGLDRTSADWVLLLDADDELIPAGVARMVEVGARNSACCVQGGRIKQFADGRVRAIAEYPRSTEDGPIVSPHDVWMPIALFGSSGLLVSRTVLAAGVRFDESIRIQEDREFLSCAAAACVGPICTTRAPALRVIHSPGHISLTSPANFARRVRDHLVLIDRRCPPSLVHEDPEAAEHWRRATRWLINATSKSRRVDLSLWRSLAAAARLRGWPIPIKCRARVALRSFLPSRP